MAKPDPRNPRQERVLGTTLIYIDVVLIFFALVAFISMNQTPRVIEDLSWAYIDDHVFSSGDSVYTAWCTNFFDPAQCAAPVKVSGYFGLRSATLTFRAWDQFHGNYSLSPTTRTVDYRSKRTACAIPFGEVCAECDDRADAAAAFTFILLVLQIVALVDQLRHQASGSEIRAGGWHVGVYIGSFVCALVAYLAMRYGCIEEVPLDLKYGPISILMIASILGTLVQVGLEIKYLSAASPAAAVSPASEEWKTPPTRSKVAPSTDPFTERRHSGPKAPAKLPGHVPTPVGTPSTSVAPSRDSESFRRVPTAKSASSAISASTDPFAESDAEDDPVPAAVHATPATH